MGIKRGSITTSIVTDGLVFNMDAANRASYVPDTITSYDTTNALTSGSLSGVTFVPSTGSGVWNFDGIDDVIDISDRLLFDSTNPCTIESWVFLDEYNPAFPGVCRLKTDQSTGFMIFFSTYSGYDGINFGSNSNFLTAGTQGDISGDIIGSWKHIVLVYDGVSKSTLSSYKLYIDGNNTSIQTVGSYNPTPNSNKLGFGNVATTEWNGKIANFHLYNRALSSTEVLHNYNALKGRFS